MSDTTRQAHELLDRNTYKQMDTVTQTQTNTQVKREIANQMDGGTDMQTYSDMDGLKNAWIKRQMTEVDGWMDRYI